ncbi:ferroxidase fet3 [Coemansia sp. RSA 1813]|nr:ferroxidase fet3 [Coemansia sp. RSA 1646]KAJ1769841.1 ferroxidase fet3 [Coemansia sp. RSA 1843]KAJ2087030.1 ferroxidase fet3 [Coemansia sp. RSA 986]KAJ2211857.1 ferroxidase fet3 [Coemansia sp. RSA 487]KAJ2565508.1 ferroxidase fet3 [Coemansia sp. RSA 1813]
MLPSVTFILALALAIAAVTSAKRVELDWNITYVQANPDGLNERRVIGINGKWPPPVVHVDLNDTLVIKAHNKLDVGTTLHAHGFHQNGTNFYDGVPGHTECGIAPNATFTYVIPVTQSGTFWLHGHYSAQLVDGLRTPLISHPPKEDYEYDEDMILMLEAWYHRESEAIYDQLLSTSQEIRDAPFLPFMLINSAGGPDLNRTKIRMQPGKTYRLRLINASPTGMVRFGIEQHTMRIIEVDSIGTEIKETNSIQLSAGQRTSVLVTAKDTAEHNYIFHADIFTDMQQGIARATLPYEGIVEYSTTAPLLNYTKDGTNSTVDWEFTQDVDLVPLVKIPPPGVHRWVPLEIATSIYTDRKEHMAFNNRTYAMPLVPSLLTALSTGYQAYFPDVYGFKTYPVVLDPLEDVEIALFNKDVSSHPFHLHGHDIFVMARGMLATAPANDITAGPFPVRRDTITVPPKAFAIIRFRADNPGVWIFHCHMQYHMEQGLAMAFIESPRGINVHLNNVPKDLLQNCEAMGIPTKGNALGKVGLDMSNDIHGPYPLTGF